MVMAVGLELDLVLLVGFLGPDQVVSSRVGMIATTIEIGTGIVIATALEGEGEGVREGALEKEGGGMWVEGGEEEAETSTQARMRPRPGEAPLLSLLLLVRQWWITDQDLCLHTWMSTHPRYWSGLGSLVGWLVG